MGRGKKERWKCWKGSVPRLQRRDLRCHRPRGFWKVVVFVAVVRLFGRMIVVDVQLVEWRAESMLLSRVSLYR